MADVKMSIRVPLEAFTSIYFSVSLLVSPKSEALLSLYCESAKLSLGPRVELFPPSNEEPYEPEYYIKLSDS